MRNILLTLSYDGTDFCGWQRQDDAAGGEAFRTVQGEVERALEKIHGQATAVYGSGRTDRGVHALAQAANFYSPVKSMPAENYVRAANAFLPRDVRVTAAREVPADFNARKNATSRVYRYFISFEDDVPASTSRYAWRVRNYSPDLNHLNSLCDCLRGECDCTSFCASGDGSLSMSRYIDDAHFFLQKDIFGKNLLVFQIEANAFLWKMVRTLTGTLVTLDKSRAPDDSLRKIMERRDRTAAGVTAPPDGLFLYEIKFDGVRRHQ